MNNKKFLPLLLTSLFVFFVATISLIKSNIITHYKTKSEVKSQFQNLLYEYDDFHDELPVHDCINCNNSVGKLSEIERNLALEDIEYLFSLLKYGYAGYEFFGGDERFINAKKNMIWSILEENDDKIHIDKFLNIICTELKFIQDGHLTIEDNKMCNYSRYFSSRKFTFYKNKDGFYTYIDNKLYYLLNVNNENPDNYMKLSLDENGNLIYNLGILSNTKDISIPLELLLKSNRHIRIEKVSLFEFIPYHKQKNISYNYYEIDGIPILEVNSLCRISPDDDSIEKFIDDSRFLRNKENIIIDLRNNIGGNTINIDNWYRGFTGSKLQKDIIESELYTDTSIALSKYKFETKENEKEIIKEQCLEQISSYEDKRYFPGWSPIEYKDFRPVENNVNIYILVDKSTSSAAEFFAYYLRKLDNVILIGTNTNGCTLTGNCSTAFLPNSKIQLYIPHKLYLNTEFENTDGMGLFPDLWVKPNISLERVIKYIKQKNK